MKNIMKTINSKINVWLKLLFSNPKELFKIIYQIIRLNIFYWNDKRVINSWERYDPLLSIWTDNSHLPRYNFAKNYISDNDIILDIASWTWYGTEILSKKCKKAYWVDISKDAIKYAKEKRIWKNLEYIQNDLYKNTITADIVVSFETIEHIPDKKIEETIEKLISYSNKLLIWSYPYKEKKWSNPHHFQFDLDENNLNSFISKYNVEIYYQDMNWQISDQKINDSLIQNLIFIIKK